MKIENKFLDLVVYFISFIVSIFRSFLLLIWVKKTVKKWLFFQSLDFIFRVWPYYFWQKPNLFKIWNFIPFFIKYLFYNDKNVKK